MLSPFTQFGIYSINYGIPQIVYVSTSIPEYYNAVLMEIVPAYIYVLFFIVITTMNLINASIFSLTNIQLMLFLGLILTILLQLMGTKVLKIKPEYWQIVVESFYTFLLKLIIAQAGHKSLRFFSGIYTIFFFVFIFNLLGLLPFGFTVTGHIILTFTLAISFFIAWTIIAFKTLGLSFFRIFLPRNIPKALAPLLVVIEILSFSIRPISLAIRLFANMLAGHILLFIISTAVLVMSSLTSLIGFIPFIFVIIFFILELGIAFLQAYVFTILLAIYLRDALYVH